MPIPGIIFPSTIYRDSGAAIFVGVPGGSDTIGSGGPYVYNDINEAIFVGVPEGSDSLTHPGNTFFDSGESVFVGSPSLLLPPTGGPYTYNDSGQVSLVGVMVGAGRAFYGDMSRLPCLVSPGGSDTYIPGRLPNRYYDFGIAPWILSPSGSDTAKNCDSSRSAFLGVPSGSDSLEAEDSASTFLLVNPASQSWIVRRSSGMTAFVGSPGGTDIFKARDRAQSSLVLLPSASDTAVFSDKSASVMQWALRPNSVPFATHDGGTARLVGNPSHKGTFDGQTSSQAQFVGIGLARGRAIFRDASASTAIWVPSATQAFKHFDRGSSSIVMAPTGIDSSTYHDSASAAMVGGGTRGNNPANSNGIVPAIRYHVNKSIPSLTNVVEALPDAEVLQDLVPPFIVIFGSRPIRIELAVQDQAYNVSFDLVYVCGVQAAIDNPPSLRASLRVLEQALLADYRLVGSTSTPSCFGLNIDSTPFERMNEYNKLFAQEGQTIEVAVSTITVSYIEFNLGV